VLLCVPESLFVRHEFGDNQVRDVELGVTFVELLRVEMLPQALSWCEITKTRRNVYIWVRWSRTAVPSITTTITAAASTTTTAAAVRSQAAGVCIRYSQRDGWGCLVSARVSGILGQP